MNLPNKLTILRMIMIPVFLVVLYIPGLGMAGNIAAAAIYLQALQIFLMERLQESITL